MKDSIQLIEAIKKIFEEYKHDPTLHRLVNIYERLAINLVFLWEEEAQLKKEYNTSYYTRKIQVSHSYISNKAEKITDKMAQSKAETQNEELLKTELEQEALLQRLNIFRQQGNRVLEAMRTKISFEKWEMQRETIT